MSTRTGARSPQDPPWEEKVRRSRLSRDGRGLHAYRTPRRQGALCRRWGFRGLCAVPWGLPFLGSDPLGWSAGPCLRTHGSGSGGSAGSLQSGSLRLPSARAPGLGPAGSSPRPHPGRAGGSVSASSVATARALQTAVGRADIFTVLPVSERLPRRLSLVSQGCPRAGLSPLKYFMEGRLGGTAVKHLIVGFGSGPDLRVKRSSPILLNSQPLISE